MARHFSQETDDSARAARRRWRVALVVWLCVIWGHSLLAGPQSSTESGLVVSLLRPVFSAMGVTDPDLMSLIVRKTAHFTEYLILGVIVANNWRVREVRGVRAALLTLVFVAVPLIDELGIQRMTPGRSGNLVDVGIDCAGFAVGTLCAWLWIRGKNRN